MAEFVEYITARATRYVAANYEFMRKVTRQYCKFDDFEEVFSDIIYTAVSKAFDTYCANTGAKFDTHVIGYVRFYSMKWYTQRANDMLRRSIPIDELPRSLVSCKTRKEIPCKVDVSVTLLADNRDDVQYLLSGLDRESRAIVYLKLADGWLFKDIAAQIGCSMATCQAMFSNAMIAVKANAERLNDG